ncbi:hypothetical protein MPER_13089, partial [Moniliophthora perniciosa FA553]
TSSIHMYQRLYYDMKIKPEFDAFWEHHVTVHPDADWISEMNRFTVKRLKTETEEVKAVVKNAVDKEYDEAMTEYRQIGQWKSSAEKYQYHWKKADRVVPTLCDAVAEHLGVGVLLTTFGPMADGEIDVRSVCALVPDAQTKQTLAQFNLEGLTKTHQMCQEYAQALFSKEQCLSRIPTTEDVEGDQDDSSGPGPSRLLNLAESSSFASALATIITPIATTPHPTAVTAVPISTTPTPPTTNPSTANTTRN